MACGLCYFALAQGFLTGSKFDLRRGVNLLTYKLKQTSIFNRYIPQNPHMCFCEVKRQPKTADRRPFFYF